MTTDRSTAVYFSNRINCMQHNNRLTGQIPGTLGQLSRVVDVLLHGNKLSGCIPASFKEMPELRRLTLSFNMLTGSIPKELSTNPRLKVLFVNDNKLSGTVPAGLGAHEALRQISINGNDNLKLTNSKNAELQSLALSKRLTDAWVMNSEGYLASKTRYRKEKVSVHIFFSHRQRN